MTAHVNISGVWKAITDMHVNVSGTWKEITEGWVNVSGTWKQFFASGVVTITGQLIEATSGSGPVTARLLINTDGTLDKDEDGVVTQIAASTDWIIPNNAANSSYEVRFTNHTGDSLAGVTNLTEDVWEPIDEQKIIGVQRNSIAGPGQTIAAFDLEIRFGSSGPALDSGSYTLFAELT